MGTALEAAKDAPTAIDHADALPTMRPTSGIRVAMAFELYMSTLYVVFEAWTRLKHTDPEIDQLFADKVRVAQLRECRDKVFHPGDANDPIEAFHPNHRDRSDWTPRLHKALLRYCQQHYRDFPPDPAEILKSLREEEERRLINLTGPVSS